MCGFITLPGIFLSFLVNMASATTCGSYLSSSSLYFSSSIALLSAVLYCLSTNLESLDFLVCFSLSCDDDDN